MRNYRLEVFRLVQDSRQGMTAAQAAEHLGCSSSTTSKHLGRLASEGRLRRLEPREEGMVYYVTTTPVRVGPMPERFPAALREALRRALMEHPELGEFLLDPAGHSETPDLIGQRIK